jgi:hypothetical protein
MDLGCERRVNSTQKNSSVLTIRRSEHAQTAIEKAIVPLVEECLETVHAQKASRDIARMRSEAEAFARDPSELKVIRSMLHQPTMDLRKGLLLNETAVLQDIKEELTQRSQLVR